MTGSLNEERWIKKVSFLKKNTNLPPHKDIVAALQAVIVKVVRVETFGIFVKRLKLTLEKKTCG